MKEKVLYNIKTIAALTALTALTCDALAEGTLTWAGSSDSPSWTEAGNWRDGGGETPSAAPMDGSAPLVFNALPQGAAPYRQVVGIGSALSVGSLTDGEPLSFRREFSYTPSSALSFLGAQTYRGYWNINKANVQLNMASGTTLEMLQADGALVLPNVDSGTATISSLGGMAVLDKRGSGGLSVGSSAGPGAVVHVESGTVTLLGQPDGLGPAPGAVLRVDASREDTMEIEEGADGRRYISRWNDADGRDSYIRKSAYTSSESWSIPYCTPPFVSPATANGLPLVDFGAAREENVGTLGPMNCAAQVIGPAGKFINNAREVFYVGWITDDRNDNAAFSGGTTHNFYRNGKTLFHSSLASTGVINGDVYLNGFRRRATYTSSAAAGDDIANLHVLSVGSCVDLSIDLMGTDRYYAGHTGGMRFGEVIIYTNNLTTAERLATHRYLMAKWMPGSTDAKFDYDAIDVKPGNSAGGTIAVPEGRTAHVGQISLPSSNGLTKSGEGKLEVGALARADATIEVQSGSVALVGVAPFGDQQPANSPALWLDATAQSSFEADGDRISKWKDCRVEKASTVYATAGTERSASKPYVIESAQNGHDVVCFGTSSSDRAYASLSGCTSAYEGFIAIKLYTDSQANVFGSSGMDFYRDSKTYLLHPYAGNDGRAARWAVDGVVCNPIRDNTLKSDGIWHVVNFSALKSLSAGYLVIDKRAGVNTGYGCCEVGEVLYYDRVLSAGERRQTEAYLMKRWLGKDHPAKAQSGELASMTFASGVPAVLDSDRDLAVVGVVADGTSLTKCGAGSVTVDNLSNADSITSISVEGGTLVTPFASTPGAAVFHFDASDARTFETNGESLVKWLDVRRNGIYAAAETPAHGNASVAYPTLKTATIGGESRTYVDFGAKNEVWDDSNGAKQAEAVQATKASGMRIYNGSSSVREAHVVYADQTTGSKQHIFTSRDHYHFHRNGSKLLATYEETANARGGYIAIDGESCASDADLSSGFHLVSMAPSGNTAIDTIAADRLYSGRGGSRICEILAFNEALSAESRATLQGILKYKWLGIGEKPYVAKSLASLTVKQGACYRNKDSHVSLDIASFAGGGTVDFEKATVIGTLVVGDSETESAMATFTGDLRFGAGSESADGTVLSIDLISSSAWDRVQVGGAFVQDGIVALVLNVPNRKALAYGEYPIVTAAALSDIDFSKWTVSTSDSCNLVFSLYRRNGEIGVRVEPIGFRMIVR